MNLGCAESVIVVSILFKWVCALPYVVPKRSFVTLFLHEMISLLYPTFSIDYKDKYVCRSDCQTPRCSSSHPSLVQTFTVESIGGVLYGLGVPFNSLHTARSLKKRQRAIPALVMLSHTMGATTVYLS